jgi:hypothetical protein
MDKKDRGFVSGISRREFLKDAGLIIGGAAVSPALLNGCTSAASTSAEFTVYDINGAHEITALFAQRLGDLNGKTVAGLAADPTKWQTHRTFPYIFEQIKAQYPGVTIIPQTEFTMGTGINNNDVAQAVKDRGVDACVIGNAA